MALPRSFKTDESFLEKIAMGATGTKEAFDDLKRQDHDPIELERGSMSFKIWKAIKIKRVRVPDILCLRCGRRVESRAKTKIEISMSHSTTSPERGWDFGLEDQDVVAIVHCRRTGEGPLDWRASSGVQYVGVDSLRQAWQAEKVRAHAPKGAQEGFETRVTWPSRVAAASGVVELIGEKSIRYREAKSNRARTVRLTSKEGRLQPLVAQGDHVDEDQILASVVSVTNEFPCERGASITHYSQMSSSMSLSDRYTAAKALGRFPGKVARDTLRRLLKDEKEHIYVRVDAAASLMRRGDASGIQFLTKTLADAYLENRLEAVIVLGEVGTAPAAQLLMDTLQDGDQHHEIRAGAAWSLGEIGLANALPVLVDSFSSLETGIKMEAARALAKVARLHLTDVVEAFPIVEVNQRPGIAWALSKAGGFSVEDLLPALSDEDARQWVAFLVGTQKREVMLPELEMLAQHDPEVYFAATVLWKIADSWIDELEEY